MAWTYRGHNLVSTVSISAIAFDPELELLWVAEQYGSLSSYTTQGTQGGDTLTWNTYSCFSATTAQHPRHIGFLSSGTDTNVVVADREAFRSFKRGGLSLMYLPVPENTQPFIEQFQVSQAEKTIYFSGTCGLTQMKLDDSWTPSCQTVAYDASATIENLTVEKGKIVTGSSSGLVVMRDTSDLSVVASFSPTRNPVRATTLFGNTLMVAFGDRAQAGSPTTNASSGALSGSMIKIYDVRMLSSGPTAALTGSGPTAVHTVELPPSGNVLSMSHFTDSFASQTDRVVILTPQNYYLLQLGGAGAAPSYIASNFPEGEGTCLAVSPSNTCLAVGSDRGYFSTYGHPLTQANFIMANLVQPPMPKHPNFTSWSEDDTARGFDETIAESSLLSSWPEDNYMILTVPQKLHCVEKEKNSVVPNQWGLHRSDCYLPDRKDHLAAKIPNPYPFNSLLGSDPIRAQELLLELRKEVKRKLKPASRGNDEYAPLDPASLFYSSAQHKDIWKELNEIPHRVIGFDNSYPESWIGALLQCLFLCQPPEYPIRRVILRHLCSRPYCVTCEIAIIFSNMLVCLSSYQQGPNIKDTNLSPVVQIAHLLRTMAQIPAFASVFEKPRSRDDAVAKMHCCQRALLQQLHKDLQSQNSYPLLDHRPPCDEYKDSIAAFFGTEFVASGSHKIDPRFNWDVPGSALKVDEGLQHLLKEMELSQENVQIKRLPLVIVLLLNPEHSHLRPPSSLKITRNNGEIFNYLLNSNVIHLADDAEDVGNFVTHQRIKDEAFALVNDYRITHPMPIADLEQMMPALRSCTVVVSFYALSQLTSPSYAANDSENRPPNLWHTLGPLLLNDVFGNALQRGIAQRFKSPLKSYQDIKPGTLVAIDAEYVVLKWSNRLDDMEVFPAYSMKKHMALARMSCIMSQSRGEEVTIIDDYVHTPEEIEDYVTQFSGIRPGDLDALKSTKPLTALKATYLKLRALVDAGVIFVGHGLAQDFRVLNIAVPKRQIIDTLLLFHKPGVRYVSLRFLAYHLLGEKVQEAEHDSIEDARTSLRLYRAYQTLQEEGTFEKKLDQILKKGTETNWYVPSNTMPKAPSVSQSSPVGPNDLSITTDVCTPSCSDL